MGRGSDRMPLLQLLSKLGNRTWEYVLEGLVFKIVNQAMICQSDWHHQFYIFHLELTNNGSSSLLQIFMHGYRKLSLYFNNLSLHIQSHLTAAIVNMIEYQYSQINRAQLMNMC